MEKKDEFCSLRLREDCLRLAGDRPRPLTLSLAPQRAALVGHGDRLLFCHGLGVYKAMFSLDGPGRVDWWSAGNGVTEENKAAIFSEFVTLAAAAIAALPR